MMNDDWIDKFKSDVLIFAPKKYQKYESVLIANFANLVKFVPRRIHRNTRHEIDIYLVGTSLDEADQCVKDFEEWMKKQIWISKSEPPENEPEAGPVDNVGQEAVGQVAFGQPAGAPEGPAPQENNHLVVPQPNPMAAYIAQLPPWKRFAVNFHRGLVEFGRNVKTGFHAVRDRHFKKKNRDGRK
jgi:hypothetical protein